MSQEESAGGAWSAICDPRRRIVATGGSGWIGRNLLALLAEVLGPDRFARQVIVFGSAARSIELSKGLTVMQRPMAELGDLDTAPTALFHLAFLTKDRAEAMDEEGYRQGNLAIRQQLLAALDPIGVDRLFVASSGAVYRADDESASSAMRVYGKLKRDDERVFSAWANDGDRCVVNARVFSLSGAFINKPETYALAAFILDALSGRPVRIQATRPVYRSYVAVTELLSLVLTLLAEGQPGARTFDSGGEPLEMGELAQIVSREVGAPAVERSGYDPTLPPDRYVGDNRAYRSLLREAGLTMTPIERQVAETADFLARQQVSWAPRLGGPR